jgi:2-amino-4-hydroxy-6-hydroxymethyldihydropteridine diphosphokinase
MTPTYIALGSNLKNPEQQLNSAVKAMSMLADSQVDRVSSFYRSRAIGPGTQPDYLNAVLCLLTDLPPVTLLQALQEIELDQGRERSERWAPRTLDLDLLLYGEQTLNTEKLTIPHPRMHVRDFVLYPLREISDTNLMLPNGIDLDTLIQQCPADSMARVTTC